MNITLPLQQLYQQGSHLGIFTPLDKWVCAYVKKTPIDFLWVGDCIDKFSTEIEQCSPLNQIEKWREILALSLLIELENSLSPCKKPLAEKCSELMKGAFWEEFQLESTLRAINSHFLDLPCKKVLPHQMPSGAIPIEYGGHWPWASVPHALFQAELGILWFMLGELQNDQTYQEAFQKVAEWQLNTLDHHYSPFKGLYVREEDASSVHLLSFNYLLFLAAGMKPVAQKLLEELKELMDKRPMKIPPYIVILEAWINNHRSVVIKEVSLPSVICDSRTALAGYRSPSYSLALTLSGGGTGMGSIHREEIQLVSYGPQQLPLGDCHGFGIEVCENHAAEIKVEKEKIDLRNTIRMISKPKNELSKALFRKGDHSGLWIEARQRFSEGKLNIEATFLGLAFENMAFAFFANAPVCYVDQLRVNPRSFERYQGEKFPIQLKGESGSTLMIDASGPFQEMSVIPLGGGNSFWGADFLIAYLLNPNHNQYSWEIIL